MPQPATRKRSSSTAKSKRSQSSAKTPTETRVQKGGKAAASGRSAGGRSSGGSRHAPAPSGNGDGNGGGSRALELFSPTAGHGTMSALARRAAKRAAAKIGETARERAGDVIRSVAQRAVDEGREVAGHGIGPRLPIQRSIDIAVPLRFAWEQWMALDFLPEGVDRVQDIERDGDELTGSVGRRGAPWRADILDERERQSFAWQSTEGSDCAGLITFHRLSERLTRLELNLDVVPGSPADVVALSTHLAHRRAELDLRRFKARLELINPDLYEDEDEDEDEDQDDGTEDAARGDETEDEDEGHGDDTDDPDDPDDNDGTED